MNTRDAGTNTGDFLIFVPYDGPAWLIVAEEDHVARPGFIPYELVQHQIRLRNDQWVTGTIYAERAWSAEEVVHQVIPRLNAHFGC